MKPYQLAILTGIALLSFAVIYISHSHKSDDMITNPPFSHQYPQSFTFSNQEFLLNGKPFYIAAGEIHYSRVPSKYWRTRIQTIKAMGLNTLSVYLMWNFHEIAPGQYDFESPDKNLRQFLQIAKEEEMYVLLRPGPYVCAEWDFGGHPFWLLKEEMKLRTTDPKYIEVITPYINKIAEQVEDYLITNNGTIIMVQIENEYGNYSTENSYPVKLKQLWEDTKKITVPYYTADSTALINGGHVPGAAIGLNPGVTDQDYNTAHKLQNNVPVLSSETYPGWLTHWSEKWAGREIDATVKEFESLAKNRHSFSMYMVYGGSSFGLWAGSDNNDHDSNFQPDITSYDYDAPINEQGAPTEKFFALREMFKAHFNWNIPEVPTIAPIISIKEFTPTRVGSLWNIYNQAPKTYFDQFQSFESMNQNQGIVAYAFSVSITQSGLQTLSFDKLRDYAHITIQVDENVSYKGTINRMLNQTSFNFTHTVSTPVTAKVTIFVEALGHTNFGRTLFDNKGIIGNAYFNNQKINNIEHTLIPLDAVPKNIVSSINDSDSTEQFFKATFTIDGQIGDTYINVTKWNKGYVWVNGFNLGRYWKIGPQFKLFCPSTVLKQTNEIVIFDLEQNFAAPISGDVTLQ